MHSDTSYVPAMNEEEKLRAEVKRLSDILQEVVALCDSERPTSLSFRRSLRDVLKRGGLKPKFPDPSTPQWH